MVVDATVSTHMVSADSVMTTAKRRRDTPAATKAKRGKPRSKSLGEMPTIGDSKPKSNTDPA
jgi:hypothetical protein